MIRRFLTLLFFFTAFAAAVAQSPPREWILTLQTGVTKYYGDFTDDRFQSGGALTLRRFADSFDDGSALYYELGFGAWELNYKTTGEMIRVLKNSEEIKSGEVNRSLVAPISFQLLWRKRIGPKAELFLGGGAELGYFQPYNHAGYPLPKVEEYGKWEIGIPISAQLDYMLSDALALNFHAAMHYTFTDFLDGVSSGTANDLYITAGIGIAYSFPAPDRDDDYDGLTNRQERERFKTNPQQFDTDHDGLSDGEEVQYKTNPLGPDSDNDGVRDGDEVRAYHSKPLLADTDHDGLADGEEVTLGTCLWKADTDGDNLTDQVEVARGTDPLVRDTDNDGLPDGIEATSSPLIRDTDNDGLPDEMESAFNLRPYDEDFDRDGLFDKQEIELRTDPKKADTDNDGVRDYAEVFGLMTDPRNPDSDGDGVIDASDPDPIGKGMNTQRSVSVTIEGIFRHERMVDESAKGLITMLHMIRSASPGHVREIAITVYGENTGEAKQRREHLREYLDKMTYGWAAPPIEIEGEVVQRVYAHAKLVYLPK